MTPTERKPMADTQVRKRNGFWIHLAVFLAVNAGLITLNLLRTPDKLWFRWVLLGWGAGLLLNGFCAFSGWCEKNGEVKSRARL